jgi:uncharacterized FlaG/YvyC family protein
MDTQAIDSTKNQTVIRQAKESSSSTKEPNAVPADPTKPSGEIVDLSSKAQSLVENKKGVQSSSSSEQKKFSVTDDNDVVVQVIDLQTHKVLKSIPTEEEIQLKNAMRDEIDNIIE